MLLTPAQGKKMFISWFTGSAGSPPSSDARLQRDASGSSNSVFKSCYLSRLQTQGRSPHFPAQPFSVAGGSGCAMPWGSWSPSCALDSWQSLSARPWTSLILLWKGKMGWFPIASPLWLSDNSPQCLLSDRLAVRTRRQNGSWQGELKGLCRACYS